MGKAKLLRIFNSVPILISELNSMNGYLLYGIIFRDPSSIGKLPPSTGISRQLWPADKLQVNTPLDEIISHSCIVRFVFCERKVKKIKP